MHICLEKADIRQVLTRAEYGPASYIEESDVKTDDVVAARCYRPRLGPVSRSYDEDRGIAL